MRHLLHCNCIQLQARCKMCSQVSGRYLIAAALDAARNGLECQTNSYLMYEPAARDVQRKCQMRCLSIFCAENSGRTVNSV